MMEKRDSSSPRTIKIAQISVPFLLLVDVINEWPQFISLCEKVNNFGHINKLILIYFTWLVHNFVNHIDVCLMPHNNSKSLHHREDFICLEQLCWRHFTTMLCWRHFFPLPSPFITTLASSLATLSCSHNRSRQNHILTRVRLAYKRVGFNAQYFCHSPTFRWRERNKNCP